MAAEDSSFMAFEDGNVFLSKEELDDYRMQKMQAAWQEGEYA